MPYRPLARRVGNVMRLTEIVQVMVRYGFADIVHRLGLHEGIPARFLRGLRIIDAQENVPETRGHRLRTMLSELGPTFVKFGQILSTRPDLVGREIAFELGGLQDRVETIPFERMRPVVEQALGGKVEHLYESFDTTPVASASLSQVYFARLKGNHAVAVKVQRPDIRRVIEADLSLMRAAAEWAADRVTELGWIDPVGMVDELARALRRELDFTIEARIIELFQRQFADHPEIFVPPVYPEYCAPEVLTMGWIEGVRIDALDRFAERESDPRQVARIGCDIMCRQVFEHRLFHADPHPGNILLTRRNRIAFLDYGMMGHLERADVVAVAELLRSIFQNDPQSCVQAILSITTGGDVYDRDAFRHAIGEFIAFEAQSLVSRAQIGRILEELVAVLRRYELELAPRLSLLLKALATIESTGRTLDPNLNMAPIIRPYVERVLLGRFSPRVLREDVQQRVTTLLRLSQEIPRDAEQIVRLLRRGQFKIRLNHEGLTHFAAVVDRASNRLTFGVITASIVVGSSLLIHAGEGHETLGLVGYLVAGFFGISLIISIFRSRNY